ncbi:hypothetical protein FOMPIDRAFT_1052893 [Fomitopsis schrenkii]|uniref:Uncharacterized protein n=1 Tax=Fomitopsis schrenkii TaxID=2126942 RepID=S8FER5_FOMSC|nr:hypothetical protein FOMPIDRAFT_1052893 [Fomitopsis schrenkii]
MSPVFSPSSAYVVTSPVSARTNSLASLWLPDKSSFGSAEPGVSGTAIAPTTEANATTPTMPERRASEVHTSLRQAEDGGVSVAGGRPILVQVVDEMSVVDSVDSHSDQTLPPPYSRY